MDPHEISSQRKKGTHVNLTFLSFDRTRELNYSLVFCCQLPEIGNI